MNSSSAPTHAGTWITSYYAQLNGEIFKGLTLTAGGREDQHKTFGSHFTGQAAARPGTAHRHHPRASWGQGFKAPSLFQLYSQYGTLGLRPENTNSCTPAPRALVRDKMILSATHFPA